MPIHTLPARDPKVCVDPHPAEPQAAGAIRARIRTDGKFFARGTDRFFIKGVTYGPFRPEPDGSVYHTPAVVDADFAAIAKLGLNTVRLYTAPPRWVLDLAQSHGLAVVAGIAWTQHVAFLDHPEHVDESVRLVDDAMHRLGGHPALMAVAIGNEIPAPVVRWHGHGRIERHLQRLAHRVKSADPNLLVTYANYPTTEYLELPFLDFVSFNIYLDDTEKFDAYVPRLQNLAGERPLVISEIGMDSVQHGEPRQAAMLAQKINAIFDGGLAGMFVFSFTDEWHRECVEIDQWKFGLVDRDRKPRIAADAVAAAFVAVPKALAAGAPKVSVIICSFNGAATIEETIRQSLAMEYPDFEVIVVDDGSTDGVAEIAAGFSVRSIRQKNLGLGVARNAGLHAATGEIVAYIDDDAWPDQQWLAWIVRRMMRGDVVGAGGPNLPVPGDGVIADCVAHTPGGPTHVLLDDTIAEHIPGCNMAFFRQKLLDIGGFDPRFKIAGDDVDICWRLQQAGGVLGFSATAQVWHHRRKTVGAFWRQQVNYGWAEALLERKWPGKYNTAGHLNWTGRLYGGGVPLRCFNGVRRIYHGVWGEAPFQQSRPAPPGFWSSLPMMPEWYVLLVLLTVSTAVGLVWWPILVAAIALAQVPAVVHACRAILPSGWRFNQRLRTRAGIALLHQIQPLARCIGRYGGGLTPWRSVGVSGFVVPFPSSVRLIAPRWKIPSDWLSLAEQSLQSAGVSVRRGGDFDRHDLDIRGGLATSVRVTLLTENLGEERQVVRWRMTPRCSPAALLAIAICAAIAITAVCRHQHFSAILFSVMAIAGATAIVRGCGAAMWTFRRICIAPSSAPNPHSGRW